MSIRRPSKAEALPHSWRLSHWPDFITPGRQSAAKHMARTHRDELIACGALVRIGRDLTFLGEGYALFLSRHMKAVEGYVPPGIGSPRRNDYPHDESQPKRRASEVKALARDPAP